MKNRIDIKFEEELFNGLSVELVLFPKGSGHGEDYRHDGLFRVMRQDETEFGEVGDIVSVTCSSLNLTKSGKLRKQIVDRINEVVGDALGDFNKMILINTIETFTKTQR